MRQTKKSWIIRGIALFLCAALLGGCGQPAGAVVRALTPVPDFSGSKGGLTEEEQKQVTAFSLRLMREAAAQAGKEGEENPVLSPVSAYAALLLVACGSEGDSAAELEQVLGLARDQWSQAGKNLMESLNQTGESLTLTAANSLWMDEEAQILEAYIRRISEEMKAEIFQGDLSTEEIQKAVNGWVKERTNGLIPAFRDEPYSEDVVAALINAVCLEAEWQQPFESGRTTEKPFYTAEKGEVSAEYLCDDLGYRDYIKGDGMEGILLPYAGGSLAFVALRATDGRTPQELLGALSPEDCRRLPEMAASRRMIFSMPKFALSYGQNLNETLKSLGLVKTMTPGEADLSAMGTGRTGEPLFVSSVQQKVKIQVDEEGTKAAAVTEILVAEGGLPMQEEPLELHFDRPYLYLLIDQETGVPLFLGIMENPETAK